MIQSLLWNAGKSNITKQITIQGSGWTNHDHCEVDLVWKIVRGYYDISLFLLFCRTLRFAGYKIFDVEVLILPTCSGFFELQKLLSSAVNGKSELTAMFLWLRWIEPNKVEGRTNPNALSEEAVFFIRRSISSQPYAFNRFSNPIKLFLDVLGEAVVRKNEVLWR